MRPVGKSVVTGLLFCLAMLGVAENATAAPSRQLFTNEQLTLACQQYVNALYPASQGSVDRAREAVFRACLRRRGH